MLFYTVILGLISAQLDRFPTEIKTNVEGIFQSVIFVKKILNKYSNIKIYLSHSIIYQIGPLLPCSAQKHDRSRKKVKSKEREIKCWKEWC